MPNLLRSLMVAQSRNKRRLTIETAAQQSHSTAGVTLLEVLVSMILVTIIVTIITPPIFLAVGTRVRNRRTEQAMQLAQDEIERVRLLMQSSQAYIEMQDQLPAIDTTVGKTTVHTAAAPIALCDRPAPCLNAQQLARTSDSGLFIQTFREPGADAPLPSGEDNIVAFRMGVRVYGTDAVTGGQTVRNDLDIEAGRVGFTTGPGYANNPKPLVAMYTEMVRGTEAGGLSAIQEWP